MLAGEIAAAGCSLLVLERAADPASPLKVAPFDLRRLSVPMVDGFERRLIRAAAAACRFGPPAKGRFAGIDFFPEQVTPSAWADARSAR